MAANAIKPPHCEENLTKRMAAFVENATHSTAKATGNDINNLLLSFEKQTKMFVMKVCSQVTEANRTGYSTSRSSANFLSAAHRS